MVRFRRHYVEDGPRVDDEVPQTVQLRRLLILQFVFHLDSVSNHNDVDVYE